MREKCKFYPRDPNFKFDSLLRINSMASITSGLIEVRPLLEVIVHSWRRGSAPVEVRFPLRRQAGHDSLGPSAAVEKSFRLEHSSTPCFSDLLSREEQLIWRRCRFGVGLKPHRSWWVSGVAAGMWWGGWAVIPAETDWGDERVGAVGIQWAFFGRFCSQVCHCDGSANGKQRVLVVLNSSCQCFENVINFRIFRFQIPFAARRPKVFKASLAFLFRNLFDLVTDDETLWPLQYHSLSDSVLMVM